MALPATGRFAFPWPKSSPMSDLSSDLHLIAQRHLNQIELARRWRISERTLERWRWERHGPPYLRVDGRVCYRLEDILAYEAAQLRGAR